MLFPLALLLLCSCDPFYGGEPYREQPPEHVQGYAPIYDSAGNARLIRSMAPRPIEKGGKIYVKDKILFQVESGKGIHVISVADAAKPEKLRFLQVPGCEELSVKGDLLYANNYNDLVVVNISDLSNPRVEDRVSNTFHLVDPLHPPAGGWYECPDGAKGTVIGWELKTLHYPKCR